MNSAWSSGLKKAGHSRAVHLVVHFGLIEIDRSVFEHGSQDAVQNTQMFVLVGLAVDANLK